MRLKCVAGTEDHAAFFAGGLRPRRKPSSRRLPLCGMRSMSLTSLAPPLRRSSTNLAAVKRLQLGAMRDADHGGVGQLLVHQFHHLVLALFIESGSRLIRHDD